MRLMAYVVLFTSVSFAQNMAEFGAAAAGGSLAGASGKNVSDGLTAVFEKITPRTAKVTGKQEKPVPVPAPPPLPAIPSGPLASSAETGGVPLPPPLPGQRAIAVQLPVLTFALPQEVAQTPTLASVTPVLPPPPEMSPEELKTVAIGMSRADVLKLGAPASKITMYDDGHVSETYSYRQQGQKFGAVRLTDGAVSSVDQP